MSEPYPLALYRDGGQFKWDGRPTDSLIVHDLKEHDAALAEGWQEAADYLSDDEDPKPAAKRRGRPPKASD